MVITNNQSLKEENWAFLLLRLAARSRWSQFHHGPPYFYPGCSGRAAFWGATEQPGCQKPGDDLFPMDSCLKYIRSCLGTRVYQGDMGTQWHHFADVGGGSGSVRELLRKKAVTLSAQCNPATGKADSPFGHRHDLTSQHLKSWFSQSVPLASLKIQL